MLCSLCYCCVYVGNWNRVEDAKLLFCFSMNDGQFALWEFVCVIRCFVGVRRVRVACCYYDLEGSQREVCVLFAIWYFVLVF